MGVRITTHHVAMRRLAQRLACAAALAAALPARTAAADPALATLPPPLPGPAILHQPPPAAPQLENTGVWRAQPILVSGATAYRNRTGCRRSTPAAAR